MKALKDILESTGIHPDAIHVVTHGTTYTVHGVGSTFGHSEENPEGLKVGDKLSDTDYESLQDSGAIIKHVKPKKVQTHTKPKKVQTNEAAEGWKLDSTHKHPDGSRTVKVKHENGAVQVHTNKDVKTLQKLLQQRYNVKLAEEVEPEADQHIIVQLKKAGDILEHGTQGGCDVKFGDGQVAFVDGTVAVKILESMERLKPEDRAHVSEFLYQSHDNLVAVYGRLK